METGWIRVQRFKSSDSSWMQISSHAAFMWVETPVKFVYQKQTHTELFGVALFQRSWNKQKVPGLKWLNNFQNQRKYKTIKLLINCFFTYRENPGWQLEPLCQIAAGEIELCEQENREDNDVNIGRLDPQCGSFSSTALEICSIWCLE